MIALLKKFFALLLPILGRTALEVSADEMARRAYPGRAPVRPYVPQYARMASGIAGAHAENPFRGKSTRYRAKKTQGFHDVLMVAFDLRGRSAEDVHRWLHTQMPEDNFTHSSMYGDVHLDLWWVANDERFDSCDFESAVLVSMGNQAEARALLREHGLVS